MSNVRQLLDNGVPIYPITDKTLVLGLNDVPFEFYVVAWDGASTPVAANIPAGVSITYDGNTYTGSLAASSATAPYLYLVASTSQQGEYDRYITTHTGSTYAWTALGSTAPVSPVIADNLTTNDASKALSAKQGKILGEEVSELEAKVTPLFLQLMNNIGDYVIAGKYYDSGGNIDTASTFSMLDKIDVGGSTAIYYSPNMQNANCRCFNSSGTFIGEAANDRTKRKRTLVAGTKKVGISWNNTSFSDYENTYFVFSDAYDAIKQDISAVGVDLETLAGKKVDNDYINLFDKDSANNESGYLEQNGTITYMATYLTSHYIPIEAGKTYYKATESTRRFRKVLQYSDVGTPITDSYITNDTASFTAVTGAKYARVTFYTDDNTKQFSPYDTAYYPFSPIGKYLYDIFGSFNSSDVTNILSRITAIEQQESNIPVSKVNRVLENVFCIKDIFIDNSYYDNSTGALVENTPTYCCTQKIPVDKAYYYADGFRAGCHCWSSSAFLGTVQYTNADEKRYNLPENTAYIAFNLLKSFQPEGYYENGVIFNMQPFVKDYDEVIKAQNILYGKKWCVVGDSFSEWSNEQFSEGRFADEYKTYKFFIALRNDMTIVDMTLSGRTMTYPNDHTFDNAFAKPSLYQSIPADCDYITIMLGINDVAHLLGESQDGESVDGDITIGTIDSNDTGTFYGAWNVVLQWIFENRPTAHVGIIVTNGLGRNGSTGDYSEKGMQIYQALKNIVVRWNIPYIDLNGGDGKTPMMQRGIYPVGTPSALISSKWNAFATTPTGSELNGHTNATGHLYESTFIENFLRSL